MSSASPPQSPETSPMSSPTVRSMPIPIPVPALGTDAGVKSAAAQGAIISPTQVHRRASLPCWPPTTSPSASSFSDYRRTTIDTITRFSPTMYGCSPEQQSSTHRSHFAYNFSMAAANHSHHCPPSPPSSSHSPAGSPTARTEVVFCDHHHHRRQSIAVRFQKQDPATAEDANSYMVLEQHPRARRLSGHFARPPSPTGERILKGEISF